MKTRMGVSRCCCESSCTVFVPCCIRNVRVQTFFDVAGAGTDVYVERFTLTNNCNAQESMDWSSWELVGSAGGGTIITHSGMPNQGCTFGIDILPEHLFCRCTGTASNFTASIQLCNPHPGVVIVTPGVYSMSVLFSALDDPCPLERLSVEVFDPVELGEGESKTFVMEFGQVEWTGCHGTCIRNKSDVLVEGEDYLDDQFGTTCLTPVGCAKGDLSFDETSLVADNPFVEDCFDVLCPPCGCTADLESTQPIPTFISSSTANGLGAVVPAIPLDAVDNDIFLLHINSEGEDANADRAPSDHWKHVKPSVESTVASGVDGAADRTRQTVYWTRYDSTMPPNMTVPDAGDYTLVVVTCWRNIAVADDPIDRALESLDNANDTAVSVTGLTTLHSGDMVISSTTAGDNVTTSSWANASLASITQLVNESTALGSGGHIGIASGIKTAAGVVSASTATVSDNEQEANWMIALRKSAKTWATGSGCRCGCGIAEARRSCKVPKEELLGMGPDTGEITFCDDFDSGVHADGYVVIFITPDCKRTGDILRDGDHWIYTRVGIYDPPGPVGPLLTTRSVVVDSVLSCTNYQIEWNQLAGTMDLTVDVASDSIFFADFTPLPDGIAYLVAQTGSTYTVEL